MKVKKRFLLRLDPDLWNEVQKWADEESRSVNNQIEFILKSAVQKRKGKQEKTAEFAAQNSVQAIESTDSAPAEIVSDVQKNESEKKPTKKDFWVGYDEIPD